MTTSGDTQVLPRIPVPGAPAGPLPTVALTIAPASPEPPAEPAPAPVTAAEQAPATVAAPAPAAAAESHDRIYEEAMATIAALASGWSSTVERASGRHRAAA